MKLGLSRITTDRIAKAVGAKAVRAWYLTRKYLCHPSGAQYNLLSMYFNVLVQSMCGVSLTRYTYMGNNSTDAEAQIEETDSFKQVGE